MIRTILMDLDNTLLDFERCAEAAMRRSFSQFGIPFQEGMFPAFTEINNTLWREVEQGRMTREELHRVRWSRIFEMLGISEDGERFEPCFYANLSDSHEIVEGAYELLEYLSPRYALCIASNAPYEQQKQRLKSANMLQYFDHVFTSERIGYAKPNRRFFEYCFRTLGNCAKEETLIIGDSLTADIQGGTDFGIRTCWYNHSREICGPAFHPDFTVNSLVEILNLL